MWICWTLISLVQMGSKLWFRSSYEAAHYAHLIGGGLIGVMSLASLLLILRKKSWQLDLTTDHTMQGFIFLILLLIFIILGVVGHVMRYSKPEWDYNAVYWVNWFHIHGMHVLIPFAHVVCAFGVFAHFGEGPFSTGAVIVTVGVFLALFFGF